MRQFPMVNCGRGAPMGRPAFGTPEHAQHKIRLFRVRLNSGGYDDGGAYWGGGEPLWCGTDGADYRQFVRAYSRVAACAALDIDPAQLAAPLQLPGAFARSGWEFCGQPRKRFVLRCWGKFVSHHPSRLDAVRAVLGSWGQP